MRNNFVYYAIWFNQNQLLLMILLENILLNLPIIDCNIFLVNTIVVNYYYTTNYKIEQITRK